MPVRVQQCLRSHPGNVFTVDPAEPRIAGVLLDHSVDDCPGAIVAEQVLHKTLRAQMGKREPRPLDVALHKLVPGPVADGGVVPPARTEMHHVLHAGFFRLVDKCLALAQHVHGVAGDQQGAVDALQRRGQGVFLVEVHDHGTNALCCKGLRLGVGAHGRDQRNALVGLQVAQGVAADLAGGAGD